MWKRLGHVDINRVRGPIPPRPSRSSRSSCSSRSPHSPRSSHSPHSFQNPTPSWVWGRIRNYRSRERWGKRGEMWKRVGKLGINTVMNPPSTRPPLSPHYSYYPRYSRYPQAFRSPQNPNTNWVWGGIRNYRSWKIEQRCGRDCEKWA